MLHHMSEDLVDLPRLDGSGADEATVRPLNVERVLPAYEQVASQLRALIISGEIAPGDRLPVESELPAMFGVSRSTIREALRVLSSQNLVGTRRGVHGGTFVVKPQPENVSDFLEVSLGLMTINDAMGIDDLIEVRELLEVPAARLAATRRRESHLDSLRAILEQPAGSAAPRTFAETRGFHEIILTATGNAVLEVVTRPIFGVLKTRIQRGAATTAFWTEVHADHQRIVAAIEAGDGEVASECMLAHLEHLRIQYGELDQRRNPKTMNGARPSKRRNAQPKR